MHVSASRVALLLFGSGFCALVYQVAWLRMLRLIFGASTASSAAVLAIFMAGLGLGGLLLGRKVDAKRSPLGFYGRLEIGISLSAAATPFLVHLVQQAYVAMGGTSSLGLTGGTLVRLLLSVVVLGIPTFLMGGTLPAVARAVGRARDQGRRSVALLYGANTLGAVTGALVTTFASLELLGIRKSIWAACALNLGIALVAIAMARARNDEAEDAGTVLAAATPAPNKARKRKSKQKLPRESRAPLHFVLPAAAIVGFAFLLMELVWYRMLGPVLGGSSYTFGLILAVALLGIGIGGLIYAAGGQERRPTLLTFAATCSLEALFLIIPFALGDKVAILAMLLRPLGDAGFGMLILTWCGITALLVLPAAIISGYQFPLLVAILGSGRTAVGREVGLAYAWNTAGAIVGSIAGGFGLIPLLTAPGAWRAVVILLIALAGAALALSPRSRTAIGPLALGVIALVLCFASGPSAFWRHTPIGAGRMPASFSGPNELDKLVSEHRRSIVWEVDGVESSVAVEDQAQYVFLINGKADGSAVRDAPNMVMSVLAGAALHPEPKRALVIGLGSGLSAGWLAEVPGMERVDVVELEPSINHIAELCAPVNHDVLNHPKIELITGDGREFLLTSDASYDLIFSQPSNPYRAGISSLFSTEFYRAAANRLKDGGLLLQWLQGYEIDADLVRMAYATIDQVFPAIESWQVHENDLLLIAAREPVRHDLNQLRERLSEEPYSSALDWTWGVEGLEGFYSGYLASPALAKELAQQHHETGGGLNSDDHPLMEFGFVRNLGRRGLFHIRELRALAGQEGHDRPPGDMTGVDWARVADLRSARQVSWGGRPETNTATDAALAARLKARQAFRSGDLRRALVEWSRQSQPPRSPIDRLLMAEAAAEFADDRVLEWVGPLRERRPVEADAILGRYDLRRRALEDGIGRLVKAFRGARDHPWVYPATLARALTLAEETARAHPDVAEDFFEILREPFSVRLLEELRWRTRLAISVRMPDPAACVEALEGFEPHVPWEGRFLLDRFRCYQRANHALTDAAQADVQRFLDASPPRLETGLMPEPGSRTR